LDDAISKARKLGPDRSEPTSKQQCPATPLWCFCPLRNASSRSSRAFPRE
jgi:hypothetical protein